MFKKLNSFLLTRFPLLWNSRIIFIIGINFFIHLFFFLAGLAGISTGALQNYYSFTSVGEGELFIFSVLCSLVILTVWLIFYLRNNAFKSFYIIDRYHSFREFVIILVIIFSTITYFESYYLGVKVKTRSITSREQLVKEVNTINLAKAFIPQSKQEYFILNTCIQGSQHTLYNDEINYHDTTIYNYHDTDYIKVRAALQLPDAFSYKNYCSNFISLEEYDHFIPNSRWMVTRDRWIDNRQADSVRYILGQLLAISAKYRIPYRLDTASLAQLVFADSNHAVTRIFPTTEPSDDDQAIRPDYFEAYSLQRALHFIEVCYLNSADDDNQADRYFTELYVAICLAILLFCYRLYTKKVFLVSIIGAVVWAIIFALAGISVRSGSDISFFYLFLFTGFIMAGLVLLRVRGNKTIAGVLLNWHMYMLPFVILFIILIISEAYQDDRSYRYGIDIALTDTELKAKYPVGYWVDHHTRLLFRLNLLFVFLYTSWIFSRLSKKWHIMPEE
jgi:hypothetical protein